MEEECRELEDFFGDCCEKDDDELQHFVNYASEYGREYSNIKNQEVLDLNAEFIANDSKAIKITDIEVHDNSIGTPEAYASFKNVGTKDIDAFEVDIYCYDNYDRKVKHYAYGTNIFGGISQELLKVGHVDDNSYWTLYGHDNTTKIKVVLRSVHFIDGTIWEN